MVSQAGAHEGVDVATVQLSEEEEANRTVVCESFVK
jgi:hypothetical protein